MSIEQQPFRLIDPSSGSTSQPSATRKVDAPAQGAPPADLGHAATFRMDQNGGTDASQTQQTQQLREQYQHKLDYVAQQKREAADHHTSVAQSVFDLDYNLQDQRMKNAVDAARNGQITQDTGAALDALNNKNGWLGSNGSSSGTQNNGSSSGTQNTGSSSGTQNTGSSSGTQNSGSSSGTQNTGSSSGTQNGGSSSGTQSTGSFSNTQNSGSSSGTQNNGSSSNTQNNGSSSSSQGGNASGGVTVGGKDVQQWYGSENADRGVLNGLVPASALNSPKPIPLDGGAKKETPTKISDLMPASGRPAGQIAQSGKLKGLPNGEDIEQAANAEGVSPYLLAGVAAVESGNNAQNQVLNRNIKDGPLQVNSGVWTSPENTAQNAQMAARVIKKYINEAGGDVSRGLNGYNTGSVDQNGYAARGINGGGWPTYADGVANAVNNVINWEKGLGNA